MATPENKYIPGICNIGQAEISRRTKTGWIGASLTIVIWILFIWFGVPAVWRLTLFIPSMMSAMGFLQAYLHFCAYFGFTSLFNFDNIGKTDTVMQAEFRKKDRLRAWQIIGYASIIGSVIGIVGALI